MFTRVMTLQKRKLIAAVLAALLLLIVAACGGNGTWKDSGGPPELPFAEKLSYAPVQVRTDPVTREGATVDLGEENGLVISYDSVFYGWRSAINRPYIRYSRNFEE